MASIQRYAPLLARVPRLSRRSAEVRTATAGWRRSLSLHPSNSDREISSGSCVRRRDMPSAPSSIRGSRSFASSSHGVQVSKEAAKKVPVSAEDFAVLKQFLMKPAAEGETADVARAIVLRMMEHHVYADMSGQEAAVMSMVADALEDAAFVVDVYKSQRRARVAPSPMTLELTAEACASTGDWQTAHDVLEHMHEAVEIMHPSIDIYENAVRACHAAGKWMQGKQLLEALKHDRLEASADVHLLVIETCLASRELTATTRLLQEFWREFPMLELDDVRAVLDGLLAMALEKEVLDHALFFRDQLAQRGVQVPRETYEQLIELCARRREWHRARVLLAQLTNARALPVAAPSHAFTKDTDRLLKDMHAHGVAIPVTMYNAALRAYGGQTTLDKAEKLLATMKQRGVAPDTVSYAAVICSCGSDVDASTRYFEELKQSGLPMSMDAFHVYLLAPSRAKRWQVVVDRYEEIQALATEQERKEIAQDRRIMSCLATAHGNLENDDEMLRVFTGMKIHGLVPNLYVYAEAMKAYVRKGQWRHALMLFDHMWTEDIDKDKLAQFPLTWDAAVEAAIVGEDSERLETQYQQVTRHHGRLRPHTAAVLIEHMTNLPTDKIWNDFLPIKYIHDRRNVGDESQRSWQVVNAVLKRAVSEWDVTLAEKIVADAELQLGMRHFNAMTYSLMLELYARKKDHARFLRWSDKMATADSKVTAYTTRALLVHLRTLAEFDDNVAIRELAVAAARLFSVDHDRRVDVSFVPFTDGADLGRKILDIWEVRGHAIHLPTLEEYIGLCRSSTDLEDVFQRLDREPEHEEPLVFSPEFIHSLFLSMTEIAPELQPRLHNFLIDCLETQPTESATAALGVYCSIASPEESMELFQSLVAESEDGQLVDEDLVIFLASCASDPEEGEEVSIDVDRLREICLVIAENEIELGGGSTTFLLRTLLTLSRSSKNEFVDETVELVKSLLAATLEGSAREELKAFIAHLSQDPRDAAIIDELVDSLL